ncbi:ubiquinone/menaquinone biosynthesis C-methyltransferase UbiE [Campylobacterota bacterium]|nr:ubiquinone/menaquinone biosynthesis C-methyltransferase UbiE [Campylobacterota bacterium]
MDRQQKIIEMFDTISPTYDRLNRILSLGIDKGWRRRACYAALKTYGKSAALLLDVASGTGDLVLYWNRASKKLNLPIDHVICVDPSVKMLEIARRKVSFAEFLVNEASAIEVADGTADLISIGYGIRNVVEIDRAISEFFRLLKPGGVLLILEFMQREKQSFVDKLMRIYISKVLPSIGRAISKDERAYTYLPESIAAFLTKEALVEKLQNAGFEIVEARDETFAISTSFIARKPQ